MNAIPHILSAASAPWCAWTMLVLLFCAILSEWLQPGVITQAVYSLKTGTNRTYKDAPVNIQGQLMLTIFKLGTLAMALCLCFEPHAELRWAKYGLILSAVLGVVLVKMLCNVVLDYTFRFTSYLGNAYEHYANITTLIAVVLYPALLIALHMDDPTVSRWILGGAVALSSILLIYRYMGGLPSFQAIIYLVLYICTLELLPMALLLYISSQTIYYL